jgi:hypothetical protein
MPPMQQEPVQPPKRSKARTVVLIIVGALIGVGLGQQMKDPQPPTPAAASSSATAPCLDVVTGARYSTMTTTNLNDASSYALAADADGATEALHAASRNVGQVAEAMDADPAISAPLRDAADDFELAAIATEHGLFSTASGYITDASAKINVATAATKASSVEPCEAG